MWNSAIISQILKGNLYGSTEATFRGCAIDSRRVVQEEVFVAIRGEKTDGHLHILDAFNKGAGIVIAEQALLAKMGIPPIPVGKAIITVPNSIQALQALAKAWRIELNATVIAVTGSSGKTTTKDMIASVLAQEYRVHKNEENFNNELGLPLTILNAPLGTEVLVLEMGMRGLGQIKMLCEICRPVIGVLTNIGTTHMELLGTQENIAKAKWELIDSLPSGGIAILNAEDSWSVSKAKKTSVAKLFYGIAGKYQQPDIRGSELKAEQAMSTSFTVEIEQEEKFDVSIPLPGEHHVLDALAALAVGHALHIKPEKSAEALRVLRSSKMRLEVHPGVFGSTIINDVYNANPDSMQASLKVLAKQSKAKTIAVLGDMYELGELTVASHLTVGKVVHELGVCQLVAVGKLAADIARGALEAGMSKECVHLCADCKQASELTSQLIESLRESTWVLIKGSRGMKMEQISDQLKKGIVR